MSHHLNMVDTPTSVLLRHGYAGDSDTWVGPDDFRPLDEIGWTQAADVVDVLRPLGLRWLLSSPALRCRQTLVPLAQSTDLDIQPDVDLSIKGDRDNLLRLLTSPEEDGLVLCSHGEVIEDVLDRFPQAGHSSQRPITAKGGFWVIRGRGAAASVRYFAPPTSDIAVGPSRVAAGQGI